MTWESLSDVVKRLEEGTPPPPWAGLFGGSPRPEESDLVIVPVPWDATTSYKPGTARGPEAIIKASHQLDLEDQAFKKPYRAGISMLNASPELTELNGAARRHAERVIAAAGHEEPDSKDIDFVNDASEQVNRLVHAAAKEHLERGRLVGVLGGDHSSPFGLIKALAARHKRFSILHFDAHMDLRFAYEGFNHSHASIMRNVIDQIPQVSRLVQVGIRDFSQEEKSFAEQLGPRCEVFFSRALFQTQAQGTSFAELTRDIIGRLADDDIYVSFDIDGLEPTLCPNTGTPVPGGLSFEQGCYIIENLASSGKRIIGFDLCEVAPHPGGDDEWDANVGSRVLYKLCGALLHSQGKLR